MKTNVVVYRNSISRISRCVFADLGAQRPQRQRLLHRVRRRGAAVGPLQLQAQLRRHADHLGSDRIPGLPPQDRTDRRQRRWGLWDNHLVSSSTEHCPELMVTETQLFRLLNETWGRSDRSKLRRRPAQEEALWFQFQSLKLFSRDDSHWQQTPQGHMKYLRQLSEPNHHRTCGGSGLIFCKKFGFTFSLLFEDLLKVFWSEKKHKMWTFVGLFYPPDPCGVFTVL